LLTLSHGPSPDSDDGIWSYGTPQTARATTPYKFAANVPFSVEFKPYSNATYGPYFIITDATYTGEKTQNDTSFNSNTWGMKFFGTSANSVFTELGSTVKTFTDSGISSAGTTYRFDRSALGVLKAYQGGVLFHTFVDVNTQEMQMWFCSQGGTGTGEVRELKYVEGTVSISATGTIIGNANVPSSAQTKVSGVMLYKDAYGTATIGTDLKIYFTCIAGDSNWVEASSYTAVTPVFSTGIKMVKLGEVTGLTSGSVVRYKAVWANQVVSSKETQLHGIGLNY
jgi:hypothetical protein